jgi:hypothetical protein
MLSGGGISQFDAPNRATPTAPHSYPIHTDYTAAA